MVSITFFNVTPSGTGSPICVNPYSSASRCLSPASSSGDDGGARGAATADIGRLAPVRNDPVLLALESSNCQMKRFIRGHQGNLQPSTTKIIQIRTSRTYLILISWSSLMLSNWKMKSTRSQSISDQKPLLTTGKQLNTSGTPNQYLCAC